ncbi:MAG: hypothetical protein HY648_11535 [Acidobacteria bacterium]|nr:hypothetical protein [Acidobacteriota bacterium]
MNELRKRFWAKPQVSLAVWLFFSMFRPMYGQVFSDVYYFPHLALGGGWQTTLTYVNYSPQTVSCQTSFYSDSGGPLPVSFGGAPLSSLTITLPPGGTLHEESKADLSSAEVRGWARAQCSGPVKASLLFRYYQQGKPVGEAAMGAMAAPATKFVTFADGNAGIAYANPSAEIAEITFTALDSAGLKSASRALTLLPGEHGAINMAPFFGLNSFRGSVQIVSTVPIISLSLNAEAFPSFSSLPPGELDSGTALATGEVPDEEPKPLTGANVMALLMDPTNTSTVYAGTDLGIFKTTNGGQSWVSVHNGYVQSLAIDPANPAIIYAGEYPSTIAKSSDRGQNWTKISLPIGIGAVPSVAVDAADSNIVHAATHAGILRSTNKGQSWTVVKSGLDVLSLASDPRTPSTIYAGVQGNAAMWKSTSGGQSWGQLYSFPGTYVRSLAVDPVNPQTVYAGDSSGIFKTADAGFSWTALTFSSSGGALAINASNPSVIYAAAPGFGLFKSFNAGQDWSFIGLTSLTVQALLLDPKNPAVVYAGTQGAGVYKSTDNGANWQRLGSP